MKGHRSLSPSPACPPGTLQRGRLSQATNSDDILGSCPHPAETAADSGVAWHPLLRRDGCHVTCTSLTFVVATALVSTQRGQQEVAPWAPLFSPPLPARPPGAAYLVSVTHIRILLVTHSPFLHPFYRSLFYNLPQSSSPHEDSLD